MKGYLRVATINPNIKVGNPKFNLDSIKDDILKANKMNAKLCVFPELCLTGNNLMFLYRDKNILNESIEALFSLLTFSSELDMIIVVSLPFEYNKKIYEVAAVIKSGRILGLVPKNFICDKDCNDYFSNYDSYNEIILIDNERHLQYNFPFASQLVFKCDKFNFSILYNLNNYNLINSDIYIHLQSIPETVYIENDIRRIIDFSKLTKSIIITSTPGPSESTERFSYFGRSLICESGNLIAKNDIITNHILFSDIDLDTSTLSNEVDYKGSIKEINFNYHNYFDNHLTDKLIRDFNKYPYINKNKNPYNYSMHIINILSVALAKRMKAINVKNIVIGVSGGLDSTMALLIANKAVEYLSMNNSNIYAYFMPGFGTSNLTSKYIADLLKSLDIKLNTINITNSVNLHFNDINHDLNNTNITYENSQARERTQILMDIANDVSGLVVGTSDLSEIALGFSTYNGDQMSMYNVNASLPKTLIKYILNSIADENLKNKNNILLANTLKNILHLPISPELLPTENGILIQKTEEILGNYEIHDFIMYNYLKYNYDINKIFDLTLRTFVYNTKNEYNYTDEYIKNCINIFFDRFYKSQYKRSTSPDSVDIGLPNLNAKYSFKIPNDSEIDFKIQ